MRSGPIYAFALAIAALAVSILVFAGVTFLSSRPAPPAPSTELNLAAACASPGGHPDYLLHRVAQQSMRPVLEPNDVILVDARPRDAQHGEIVVFTPPGTWTQGDGTPFPKRVIAVEGESVQLQDGAVLVDGVPIDEPYVARGPTLVTGVESSWTLDQGQLFVLGDRRANSADSRIFGPIHERDVLGVATWRCSPAARAGPVR